MINKILVLLAIVIILTNITSLAPIIKLALTINFSYSLTLKMLIKLRNCGVLFYTILAKKIKP